MFVAAARRCALPVTLAIETMRPLPVRTVSSELPGVLGVAVIRGGNVPVIDVGALFGDPGGAYERFITIDVAGRVIALAVRAVLGVHRVNGASWQALPKLLGASDEKIVAAIARADDDLVLALDAGRLLPPGHVS